MTQTQIAELAKTIEYIGRNANKINEHNWKMYKEQILGHLEDAKAIVEALSLQGSAPIPDALNRTKSKKPKVLHTECLDKNRDNNDECKYPIGSCELCKNRF